MGVWGLKGSKLSIFSKMMKKKSFLKQNIKIFIRIQIRKDWLLRRGILMHFFTFHEIRDIYVSRECLKKKNIVRRKNMIK